MKKMLTKEECLDALSTLEMEIMNAYSLPYTYKERVLSVSGVLFKLIKEHFDNPPLKWEELHEDMWVWDNYTEEYITVYCDKFANCYRFYYAGTEISKKIFEKDFEENRYFRKQVEE